MGTTLEFFEHLVKNHDLTYSYSDDAKVWRVGEEQLRAIKEAAKSLPLEDVKRIWNAKVDKTLVEGSREAYYWRS